MSGRTYKRGTPPEAIRADLVARLRDLAPKIEHAIFARIRNLSGSIEDADPAFVASVREAIAGALKFGLETLEGDGAGLGAIPVETAKQARQAARERVSLDTVLRCYAAGNRAFEEFIIVETDSVPSRVLCRILSDLGPSLDRLLESVAAEYQDEFDQATGSGTQRQAARVLRFLEDNSLVGPTGIDYDFDAWHVGVIQIGYVELTARTLRVAADRLGYQLLSVARDREVIWTWLGLSAEPDMATLADFLRAEAPPGASMAIGEPREGVDGWRQTLWEARAASHVTLYRPQPVTRCRDVALLAAVVRDPALTTSLIETFLEPLDGRGHTGEVLRETLRAYFRADQNANTAAAALGVARHTVERRLRNVEKKLGQTLDSCNAQLQVALGVEELIVPPDKTRLPSDT